ncbi:putative Short chain dehydrogenase reductase [Seiridium unicorne]|uniref:Short chain dehydrogenase reductase n=1 Tax=Seiridium unicorne TaxID=138068 RepID=A0ABR2V931_9PEZI
MSVPEYRDTGAIDVSQRFELDKLIDRSIIITGGASGLGLAYTKAFVNAGAFVTIADYDELAGRKVEADLAPWDEQVAVFEAAVTTSPFRSIDVVIANAGVFGADDLNTVQDPSQPPIKPDLRIMETNLTGTAYTANLAMHYFRRQTPNIPRDRCLIIKGSIAAYADQPGSPQYNMSKWGARGLFRNLRRISWRDNIRVNFVAPWYVRTPILPDSVIEYLASKGVKFARVEDCARAMLNIVADEGINGRSFGIVPREEAPEGYMDMNHDDYHEGDFLMDWQKIVLATSESISPANVEERCTSARKWTLPTWQLNECCTAKAEEHKLRGIDADKECRDDQRTATASDILTDGLLPGLPCDDLPNIGGDLEPTRDLHWQDLFSGVFDDTLDDSTMGLNRPSIYRFATVHSVPSQSAQVIGKFVLFVSYPFIDAGAMWQLSQLDLSFLDQSGCLQLPVKQILDEFVNEYFTHVHCFLPLLNEAEFWTTYATEATAPPAERKLSLIVFQAILFISCPALTIRQRLFDIEHHNHDDILSAQVALMLTYHVPDVSDRTNTLWLGKAIHYARSAQADRYYMRDSESERSTLKRLWWCCVLRDTIMALGLRRPLQIRPGDFDFSQSGLSQRDFESEILGHSVYSPPAKKVLVQLVVSLCELAITLNGVLVVCFPTDGMHNLLDSEQRLSNITDCLESLQRWYEKTFVTFQAQVRFSKVHDSLILFTNMAYIYYHTAKLVLYDQILLLSNLSRADGERHNTCLVASQIDGQFRDIRDHLVELESLGLIRYLPNTFVALTTYPFIWSRLGDEFVDTVSKAPEKEQKVNPDLYTDVLREFSDLYESAHNVVSRVRGIVDYIVANELTDKSLVDDEIEEAVGRFDGARENSCREGNLWFELVIKRTPSYLKIAAIVDYSLSCGQIPSEDSLPKSLQIQ